MAERLDGKRSAFSSSGRMDGTCARPSTRTLPDAGAGPPSAYRALKLRRRGRLDAALNGDQPLAQYAESGDDFASLGPALGRELVDGEGTPTWSSLSSNLVEERSGASTPPLDGVVVVRSWTPPEDPTAEQEAQAHATETLLDGLLNGVQESRVPVVGVETTTEAASAIDLYRTQGVSSVDNLETISGRRRAGSSARRRRPLATTVSRPRRPTGSPLRSTRCRSRVAELDGPRCRPQ